MSPICGLINTPNLNFCLSSSKLKFSRSKRCLKQCYTRLIHEHTQQDSNYLCTDQLCTQRFKLWHTITRDSHARNTCYLCKFKLNKKYLNALTWRMIPYSQKEVNQFKIRNPMQRSHSKRRTQCIFSPIGLPLFSNRLSIRFTQDQ